MESLGTSYGLALAAGINAYLPLLSVAISARWFHLFTLSKNFAFITQDGFIIALVILAMEFLTITFIIILLLYLMEPILEDALQVIYYAFLIFHFFDLLFSY